MELKKKSFCDLDSQEVKMVLDWRNHDSVRLLMSNKELISYEHHVNFINTLKSDNENKYYLVYNNRFPIGVVYFNNINFTTAELGIYKNPFFKNKGLGKILLEYLEHVAIEEMGIKNLTLAVQVDNIKAIRLYSDCGYILTGGKCGYFYMGKKLDYGRALIIAELSANHNHKMDIAYKTIDAIKTSGADAVKIQTYTPDTMTIDSQNNYFILKQGTIWDGRSFFDLYKEAYTPWEWHDELRDYAESLGLVFFSTPFDYTAVDFLESKNVPIFKIASFEITDIPLIEYTASKGKPMIISTGIAAIGEIHDAVDACRRMGNNDITLLKCTSSYPAPVDEANLKTMVNMKETFGVKVGLSDHTMGSDVAVAAVALGAEVIEKHFILDRNIGGPDAEFSMEPAEFKSMVDSIRNVEKALGRVTYDLSEKTMKSREFSRSLFVVEDIKAGDFFTEKNIRSIRPGYGLPPKYLKEIIGRRASTDIKKGEPLTWDSVVKVFKC